MPKLAQTVVRLLGESAPMEALRSTIARVAPHDGAVLISGESGTGKELVAKAIHEQSPRAGRRFIAINCAALPANLLESELFGHARGAFTDAVRDKAGLFEEASGSTLFLDEIGELPIALQGKLLRALQEGEIRRVGETTPIVVDVRLVAATLRDLAEAVKAGSFREDLFYRLNVLPIEVPPLRERVSDIPALVRHFALGFARKHQRVVSFSDEAIDLLGAQSWPGNVRELENSVERILVLTDGAVVTPVAVTSALGKSVALNANHAGELSIKKATRALEADLIRRALQLTGGNRTSAAKILEISHRALLYKMKDYGIN